MTMTDGRGHHRNRKAKWNLTAKAKLTLKDLRNLIKKTSIPQDSFTGDITLGTEWDASGTPRNWCLRSATTWVCSLMRTVCLVVSVVHGESSVFKSCIRAEHSKMVSIVSSNPSAVYRVLGATQAGKENVGKEYGLTKMKQASKPSLHCISPPAFSGRSSNHWLRLALTAALARAGTAHKWLHFSLAHWYKYS